MDNAQYEAMDIAQYVINYSIEKEISVSNLKLQKLLYYIQAAFLVEKGLPCFGDKIEHWRHGPVVATVYQRYKKYLDNSIKDIQVEYSNLEFDENYRLISRPIIFNSEKIDKDDRILINKVVESLSKFHAWELVDMTHEEEPWLKDSGFIKNEDILEYFSKGNNKDRIYGAM